MSYPARTVQRLRHFVHVFAVLCHVMLLCVAAVYPAYSSD